MSYELNSFYADLAQFESKQQSSQIETMIAVPTPEIETAPKLKNIVDTIKSDLEEDKEIVKPKKKKKVTNNRLLLTVLSSPLLLTFQHQHINMDCYLPFFTILT